LRTLYDRYDENRGGTIDVNEFTNLLNSFCKITPRTCAAVFNTVDENRNGRMNFDEFRRLFD
jgi:Ca2+-binding EF-hand superfamily protein